MLKELFLTGISLSMVAAVYASDEAFSASIRILNSVNISSNLSLSYLNIEPSSQPQTIKVATADSSAASLNLENKSGYSLTSSIVENEVLLENGWKDVVTVDDLDLAEIFNVGHQKYHSQLKMGAKIKIPANAPAGSYTGDVTVMLVYQ